MIITAVYGDADCDAATFISTIRLVLARELFHDSPHVLRIDDFNTNERHVASSNTTRSTMYIIEMPSFSVSKILKAT
jgi:hypothetical protein